MTESKPFWYDEWYDINTRKLKPNAPDNVIKDFEDREKRRAEYNKQWEDANKDRPNNFWNYLREKIAIIKLEKKIKRIKEHKDNDNDIDYGIYEPLTDEEKILLLQCLIDGLKDDNKK